MENDPQFLKQTDFFDEYKFLSPDLWTNKTARLEARNISKRYIKFSIANLL